MSVSTPAREPAWWPSVVPVWVATVSGVSYSVIAAANPPVGLGITLTGAVLLTFLAQLITRRPLGFLHRARLSISGAVACVALGAIIVLLTQ